MSNSKIKSEALLYHQFPTPGKIQVVPTKKHATQKDLSLAYSPGVAEPCLAIEKNPEDAYKYTSKGNLVAVISNGTAVLGLGDIGALAGKPVMEGKGLLFKIFADIDVFDIEVDTKDVEQFIQTVKNIAPTFGGINLEDIKAPEAFEIERRLKEELDIPVMHDDQHGTAIISAAALKNAVEIAEKDIAKVKIVINGAGAAAISCSRLYLALGADRNNMVMCDSKGVIRKDAETLTEQKAEFATDRDLHTLEDAVKNADVFIGLSVADVFTPKMLLTMANDPIVFAMANPNPEIEYDVAVATRKDVIMATGRSDHPNQVNNVLGFPFIFRGALDVRATKINEEMKIAAVHALANLAKEPVPEQVNITYGEKHIQFGREYIIPKPFDHRLIIEVPPAVAKAAMETGVAKQPITDWEAYKDALADRLGTSSKLMRMLTSRAKANPKSVVFAEADHLNVLKAAQIVLEDGIGKPILLGDKEIIKELMRELNFEADVQIIDPKSDEEKERRNRFAQIYWEKRKRKGISLLDASKWMRERNYFAAMMVNEGEADALVTGYSRSYPTVAKPIIELIGKADGVEKVSATNIMMTARGPMFFSDTAFNVNPSEEDLVQISRMTHRVMKIFGIEPNLAMLSYSNFGSAKFEAPTKSSKAVAYLHKHYPEICIDGEIQADFALDTEARDEKFPFTKLHNKKVNGLIFPDLNSANISYKLIRRLNNIDTIGPVVMGLKKPVHILQLGCSVDEIVNMVCVAVVDAQENSKKQDYFTTFEG
ncbi:NADP-dependent malic enzyme [Lutibacter sp.]|jgi:malate dehydrogenase (oxaloacetate-decarboxylating)(NADP+)|uniref:NADP-dependent malic enzyme n=1 Tax=Lutibacter sp. TaxID=1925666 RepID=UPI001A350625|nr:NADP-dependent malic enzyme [Lutibacter sp.]MBI9040290.1 NADP-dependent malic enzyme [Lutibacter sp.]